MATNNNPPIPTPKARLTNTYFAPNDAAPEAPTPIAKPIKDTSNLGDALINFANSLTKWGVQREKEKRSDIARKEALDLDAKTIKEREEYLQKISREAEQNGSIADGTNYFRIVFAHEYSAEKAMKEVFASALTDKLDYYANPLNEADEKEFAENTFNTEILPKVGGFYGQRKAKELYQEMAGNWFATVKQSRQTAIKQINSENFVDKSYNNIADFANGNISKETFIANRAKNSENVFKLEGRNGDEYEIRAVQRYVQNVLIDPNIEAEELITIEALINQMSRSSKDDDKNADDTQKGFNLNTNYAAELTEMSLKLAKKIDATEEIEEKNRREYDEQINDFFNQIWFTKGSTLGIDSSMHGEDADTLRNQALEAGVPQNVITSWLVENWEGKVDTLKAREQRITPEDRQVVKEIMANTKTTNLQKFQLLLDSDIPMAARTQELNFLSNSMRLREQAKNETLEKHRTNLNSIEVKIDFVTQQMNRTLSSLEAFELSPALNAVTNKILTRINKAAEDGNEEQIAPLMGVLNDATNNLYNLTTQKFDLEKADELKEYIDPNTLKLMKERNFKQNEQELEGESLPKDMMGLTDYVDFKIGIPPFLRNADDISSAIEDNDTKNITSLGPELRNSALNYLAKPKKPGDLWEDSNYAKKIGIKSTDTFYELTNISRSVKKQVVITEDGVYDRFGNLDTELTATVIQAMRFQGLTQEEKITGKSKTGLILENHPVLLDPRQTIMTNPTTFIEDFNDLITKNNKDISEEDLINTTNLGAEYKAYTKLVGEQEAISFNAWLDYQIEIPLKFAGVVITANDMKRLQKSGDK